MSPRFETLHPQGPDIVAYDLPDVHRYKQMNSSVSTVFVPHSRGHVDLVPPGCGPSTFYDVSATRDSPIKPNTAPKLGPGPGRPFSPRGCDLVPPGAGADNLYELPDPDSYKQPRGPRVARWDPAYKRFPKVPKIGTDTQYTLPHPDVFMKTNASCTSRIGPGPGRDVASRIDPRQYKVGQGADALYDVTPIKVTKPCKTLTAYTFAPPVVRKEVGARQPDVPLRLPSPDAPLWMGRLSTYAPRPRNPWDNRLHRSVSSAAVLAR